MANDTNDFQTVTFSQEREHAFEELTHKSVLVAGWTTSSKPLFFHVARIDEISIRLTIVDGDGLSGKVGEPVEFLFPLDDGQYHWQTTLTIVSAHDWVVAKGGDLSRLQRRNNFRTQVPHGYRAVLALRTFKTLPVSLTEIQLVDVSAGGVRLSWPKSLSQPSIGDTLSGVLNVTGGRQIEVFGIIKSVLQDVDSNAQQVGVEFQNLSGRDEQALLHLCLQIRRQQTPLIK